MMRNLITSHRCSVSDSLGIPTSRDMLCPAYKVVSCRIRKAKKAHMPQPGEVVAKA